MNDSDGGGGRGVDGSGGQVVAFGQFRFDLGTGELWRGGHAVRLAPKPAQVLAMLLDSAGSLVTRRAIKLEVWGDVPIDLDRSVNFSVRQIRFALGDSADSPRYIETLPKRGYRFIAPLAWPDGSDRAVVDAPRGDPGPRLSSVEADVGRGDRGRWSRVAGVLALAAALGLLGLEVAGSGTGRVAARPMLAVLPLQAMDDGGTPAYFASGLTDELITRLARLDPERLGVVAPTSSRWAAVQDGSSDHAIADRLAADYVLRGSITPLGEELRVSVRLTNASSGAVLWANRYVASTPTSPDLEFEIAARVAEALRDQAMPQLAVAVPDGRRPHPAARDAFLRGTWLLRQGPRARRAQARDFLTAAVEADSTYAAAYAALGGVMLRSDRSTGLAHLRRAVRLDSTLAAPHVSLGVDALYTGWDMEGAGRHFRRALALEPGNVLSHHPYAYYLSIAGQHDDAIRHIERALELDPVSPLVNGDVGRIYYRANRFEEAKRQCHRTLELTPGHEIARSCLLNIAMLDGERAVALGHARRLMGEDSLALAGDPDPLGRYWEIRLEESRRGAEASGRGWVALAQAAIWLDRTDEALEALENALANRSPILPQVPGDPCFAVLLGNPRFEAIIEQMGIP